MRRILDEDELEQLRWTAKTTNKAHRSAMQHTRVGGHELDVAAAFHHPIQKAGLGTAYHSIVTVDGEILHNHAYKNQLKQEDLLLLDGGAESPFGYATDVTRTWPVSGAFSPRQHRAYQAVLRSQEEAIDMVRPVRYRDIHMTASLALAGSVDENSDRLAGRLVHQGAHALFFHTVLGISWDSMYMTWKTSETSRIHKRTHAIPHRNELSANGYGPRTNISLPSKPVCIFVLLSLRTQPLRHLQTCINWDVLDS